MRFKPVWAIGLLLIAAAIVALQLRERETQTETSMSRTPAGSAAPVTGAPPPTAESAAREAAAEATENVAQAAAPVDEKQFKTWLADEARQMDLPRVDSDRKEREMQAIASRLSAQQRRALLHTARNPKSPAGEQILAAYLLVQSGQPGTTELQELITAPVRATGEAHSAAELNSARDKTLRIMALDGLASRAQTDASARAALAKAIEEIQDPYVKGYAREQLSRVQTQ